jgi:hypothetical protein
MKYFLALEGYFLYCRIFDYHVEYLVHEIKKIYKKYPSINEEPADRPSHERVFLFLLCKYST